MNDLKKKFLQYCYQNKLKINENQIEIVNLLNKFKNNCFNKNFFSTFLKKKKILGFYLFGDVGVGKTMLLNFFYNNIDIPKQRLHFNEFMIKFHDYTHSHKEIDKGDSIKSFVNKIKKECELIYFDEFQVTNIVDAMILGRLFEAMFNENIKIIITSNIEVKKLYKDGLQRDQFLPFINIMEKLCTEKKLIIDEDYRKSKSNLLDRFFFPLNEDTNFKINQLFRKLTKDKKVSIKELRIKGRTFIIKKYFEKVARFDFDELCDQNIGAEDYIKIAEVCKFIVIENISNFTEHNKDKQQRFITLIDILYEKKIPLMISSSTDLKNFSSSKSLKDTFKRTLSRLYELTSIKISN
ncbi:cell division protein ZapE [Pelagibacteraceae bacterium]|nr:cell division protein ZapE [Pelagibacteraceae bacterium]